MYGLVPPVVVAVKVTGVPGVMVVGFDVKSVDRAAGLIVTVVSLNAFALFVSVIVTLIVLLPLTE